MKILRVVIAVRLASRDHEQVLLLRHRQFVLEESRSHFDVAFILDRLEDVVGRPVVEGVDPGCAGTIGTRQVQETPAAASLAFLPAQNSSRSSTANSLKVAQSWKANDFESGVVSGRPRPPRQTERCGNRNGRIYRSIVPLRLIFFCRSKMP